MLISRNKICRQREGALDTRKSIDRNTPEITIQYPGRRQLPVQGLVWIVQHSLPKNVCSGERSLACVYDVRAQLVEKDAVSAAHAGSAVTEDVPRKSEAWTYIIQIVVAELPVRGQTRIARKKDIGQRIGMLHRLRV